MSKNINPKIIIIVGTSHLKAFFNFIRTQGVVGLAVGLVLGGSVGTMVKSLVDNIIMPPIGFLLGSTEGVKGLSLIIGKSSDGTDVVLRYGIFLNDFINFLVIAFVIYLLVSLLKVDKLDKETVYGQKTDQH